MIAARDGGVTSAESRLITAKLAARETGIPYTTLRDLALRGRVPVVRIGRAWYFERRDLDRLIERSTQHYEDATRPTGTVGKRWIPATVVRTRQAGAA